MIGPSWGTLESRSDPRPMLIRPKRRGISYRSAAAGSDWKAKELASAVNLMEHGCCPAYRFDTAGQPLPVIGEILARFGPVDTSTIAARMHCPNGRIVEDGPEGIRSIAQGCSGSA
jgi:hypothetical protein